MRIFSRAKKSKIAPNMGVRTHFFATGWEAASVALCGARGGDLRAADSPAPTPPGLQVPEVRLGGVGVLKSVTFTKLCSFDSYRLKRRSCQASMCFFCGLPTLLIVGSVYPPLNMDHIKNQCVQCVFNDCMFNVFGVSVVASSARVHPVFSVLQHPIGFHSNKTQTRVSVHEPDNRFSCPYGLSMVCCGTSCAERGVKPVL